MSERSRSTMMGSMEGAKAKVMEMFGPFEAVPQANVELVESRWSEIAGSDAPGGKGPRSSEPRGGGDTDEGGKE